MKLTVERNPETIKRYAHVRPATWGGQRCRDRCPGSRRTCTREQGHSGPHVAHGSLRRVMSVWQSEGSASTAVERPDGTRPPATRGSLSRRVVTEVTDLVRGLVPQSPSVEGAFLLVLFLGMVVFVIDWALRILAGQ